MNWMHMTTTVGPSSSKDEMMRSAPTAATPPTLAEKARRTLEDGSVFG